MKIDFNKLLILFEKEYDNLYDNCNNIPGYKEAVKAFDEFIREKNGRDFVCKFNAQRGDIILSDREAAAFIFALNSLSQ